ncbi:hypothetical protein CkaCkLH20_10559 [Colletotrichum karsti]|uniref:Uncharacterized protein n=1 Tax=Colletotrichum karsti TaxID=1095194 RepID=A0A9P6HXL7_9PEZI|nr:uncharacterized protein CkaCkLH20_10559 [Colletotrichum karsti]KAF9871927.1 hypothetical protein CkaCkLH20_10559 [Colletotrichum karsti]
MPGDARRKGGSYSTNPATMRTRAYQANLTPEKAAERKKKFAEYRSLRDVCIRVSKSDAYKDVTTRDGKLKLLSEGCQRLMADRIATRKPTCGTDIDEFVTRFHDGRWLKKHKAVTSSAAKQEESAEEAGGSSAETAQKNKIMDLADIEITVAEHHDAVADLVANEAEIAAQLNAVSEQVLHVSEVAAIQQDRVEVVEERAQRDREGLESMLVVLAEFEDV